MNSIEKKYVKPKVGEAIKLDLFRAYERLGGVDWIVSQVKSGMIDPATFLNVLAKMMPKEAAIDVKGAIDLVPIQKIELVAVQSLEDSNSPSLPPPLEGEFIEAGTTGILNDDDWD